uniref:Uncharacterized protein n=1 Tax=Anguilla anguilla TaxID=7936 RepID=A0A0E9R739_ANGAN
MLIMFSCLSRLPGSNNMAKMNTIPFCTTQLKC